MTKMCVHRVSSRRVRLSLIRADPLMKVESKRDRERESTQDMDTATTTTGGTTATRATFASSRQKFTWWRRPRWRLCLPLLCCLFLTPPSPTLSVPVCLFICLTFRCYASLFYFLVARQLIAAETTTTATTQNEIKSSDAASAAWAKVEIPFNAQWPRPLFPHYSQHTHTHTQSTDDGVAGSKERGRRQQATLVNASRVNFDYTHTQEGKQTCACLCVCV